MTHASLFTGIGGFDLAAEWMGWQNVFQVEIDEWCQKLLTQNFPNAERYRNIKEFDGGPFRGTIDVLSGGFPCQPYSTAGKRKGKEDDRHLWPEMLRVIREVSPRWVLGENVRGLTNWNGGLAFDEVQADLEAEGYEVIPFLLPACAVNAPHRRERIWFIAHASGIRRERDIPEREAIQRTEQTRGEVRTSDSKTGIITDTERLRQQGSRRPINALRSEAYGDGKASWSNDDGRWPTQSPFCGGNDGISDPVDSLKGLGNAVVPQVVYQIFKAIEQYELQY